MYYLESPEAAMEDSDETNNSEDESSDEEESANEKAGSSGGILYTIFRITFCLDLICNKILMVRYSCMLGSNF